MLNYSIHNDSSDSIKGPNLKCNVCNSCKCNNCNLSHRETWDMCHMHKCTHIYGEKGMAVDCLVLSDVFTDSSFLAL